METISQFLATPALHRAGSIAFLAALGLIMGSSILAFFAEFKRHTGSRAAYPLLSHKITGSALVWIIPLSLWGGATLFLPRLAELTRTGPDRMIALGFAAALMLYLLYHFTTPVFKIKLLHAPLGLCAAAAALLAAAYWYLPRTCGEWFKVAGSLDGDVRAIFQWLLGREEIARFGFFKLAAIALAALVFLQANAREKENRRRQPREYYFRAAAFVEYWLIGVITLQLIPIAWLYYNLTRAAGAGLWQVPELYWLAACLLFFLLGWLLLLKVIIDGLVNRRAILIITALFLISLGIFSFGPLNQPRPDRAAPGPVTAPPAKAPVKPVDRKAETKPPRPENNPAAINHQALPGSPPPTASQAETKK